ncbi:hypothetical protein prwr041_12640 [Prevotella herbatica]|uniref:Uncharacterized protein n=1 Tax=Prevotella herbatica TaxID=2801997 RepID=A0ABM7NXX5_9BACT|nr:hypothetical protein prwr041_12640 [Prevotella herbatica]
MLLNTYTLSLLIHIMLLEGISTKNDFLSIENLKELGFYTKTCSVIPFVQPYKYYECKYYVFNKRYNSLYNISILFQVEHL